MKHDRSRDRHLEPRTILDYLDHQLDAAGRRAADAHLGQPCRACLEKVRAMGAVLETMRRDRVGEVPAWLRARALEVFEGAERPAFAARLVEVIAELLFDSLHTPPPAFARRSVGEARRLRFRLGAGAIDLEIEPEGSATQSLSGRLECEDPALWTVRVHAGSEVVEVRPDANGNLVSSVLPAGALDIRVDGPGERFSLPAIEP